MASRTPEQAEAQKKYEGKIKEIKIRVPNDYYEKIEQKMNDYNASEADEKKHFTSINKFVLSILENAINEPMVSIREQNKIDKANEK